MIVVYVAVLIMYFLLFVLSRQKGISVSEYIYEYGKRRGFFGQQIIKESIGILVAESEKKNQYLQKYYVNKIKLLLRMILIGDILALFLYISIQMDKVLVDGRFIPRNAYGAGSIQMNLQAEITDADGTEENQDFVLTIEEKKYEEVVIKQMAEELAELLPGLILGGNLSLEEVRNDLVLMQKVDDYPFSLEWQSDNYSCIDSDGHVINEELDPQGTIVSLTVMFTYDDYREEHTIPVHIFPPVYSSEEKLRKTIYEMLTMQEQESRNSEHMELPLEVDGQTIHWKEPREDSSRTLFLMLCITAVVLYVVKDKELREKVEERNKQLLLDYPQLISRVTLYLGAGMTVRNVFRKIAGDYQKERQEGGAKRYIYEEILLTCHELDSGIPEASAYERFGKRCRLIQYMKFSNLLIQNLRKGSNSILDALYQEGKSAFEERKNMARKLGEEAGTKLLMPMMLMLGIVMVLIMIPAYFSFSI